MILLGDFNSDMKTEVKPGDGQAYQVLTKAGFRERRDDKPNDLLPEHATTSKPAAKKEFEPHGRPRDDERAEEDQADLLGGHRPVKKQRLLGLRPRRRFQLAADPAARRIAEGTDSRRASRESAAFGRSVRGSS